MTSSCSTLPKPKSGELSVYVVGPGFGESQVLVFPDHRVMVVDVSTSRDGRNQTIELLRALGITDVDLLVLTHTDLDHIGGLPELVKYAQPKSTWRSPYDADLRVLLTRWRDVGDARFGNLADAIDCLDALEDANRCIPANAGRDWRPHAGGYVVRCLAPHAHDQRRASKALNDLIEWKGRHPVLKENIANFLTRLKSSSGAARPNILSLALAIEWNDVRIVLAGDVENGDGKATSGWPGIVTHLRRLEAEGEAPGAVNWIRGLTVIKVAHHGSPGAWTTDAWNLHSDGRHPIGLVAPFANGSVRLPHAEVLQRLLAHVTGLGICSDAAGAFERATASGWVQSDSVASGPGAVVSVTIDTAGTPRIARSNLAGVFVRPAPLVVTGAASPP